MYVDLFIKLITCVSVRRDMLWYDVDVRLYGYIHKANCERNKAKEPMVSLRSALESASACIYEKMFCDRRLDQTYF